MAVSVVPPDPSFVIPWEQSPEKKKKKSARPATAHAFKSSCFLVCRCVYRRFGFSLIHPIGMWTEL